LVVDSDLRICAAVARLLRQAGYPTCVAAAPAEALESAGKRHPLLVVLDAGLPGVSGFELCRELRDKVGSTLPILFLSGGGIDSLVRVADLLVGADDYLVRPFIADELLARVRVLIRRSRPHMLAPGSQLTSREVEVLELLAEGLGQAEIAGQLFVSPKTVGNHIEHILGKLGVHSRAQAVARAYREHLVAG
jgi:two-component system nitrate/nitrite response regulator NarL